MGWNGDHTADDAEWKKYEWMKSSSFVIKGWPPNLNWVQYGTAVLTLAQTLPIGHHEILAVNPPSENNGYVLFVRCSNPQWCESFKSGLGGNLRVTDSNGVEAALRIESATKPMQVYDKHFVPIRGEWMACEQARGLGKEWPNSAKS